VISNSSVKTVFSGTHRVCDPETTLSWLLPLLPRMGITRLADVTWLDDIGIPVWQAVRPNSYLVSVSQGKGLTPTLAKISAAMEAVESWHAERLPEGVAFEPAGAVEADLPYRLRELPLVKRNHLNPAARLEWALARQLSDGRETLVPMDCLRLDGRVAATWRPPVFHSSSNGLAGGNTVEEATAHALYEVIERDAIVRSNQPSYTVTLIDADTVDGTSGQLIDQIRAAGVDVGIEMLPSPLGLPCFRARIVSDAFPTLFGGMGCHLDRDVALNRALTEAVQSRATAIAGARDDLPGDWYQRAGDVTAGRGQAPDLSGFTVNAVPYREVPSIRYDSLTEDLRLVGDRVRDHTGREPLVVDHTRDDLGIPVVRVVCPGLLHEPTLE
jgi:ribosomal protein S12 methylthiotransferase accessory factor